MTALASSLEKSLPSFGQATVGEILAIRDDLRPSLDRFRSAVMAMTATLVAMPASPDFAPAVADLYRERVLPELIDIKEAIDANSYIRELASGALGESNVLVTAAVGLATRNIELAALIAGVTPAILAKMTTSKRATEIQASRFFFLREAESLLRRQRRQTP